MARGVNGTDEGITVSHSSVLDFTAGLTISIWAKKTNTSGAPRLATRGGNGKWELGANTGTETVFLNLDGGSFDRL